MFDILTYPIYMIDIQDEFNLKVCESFFYDQIKNIFYNNIGSLSPFQITTAIFNFLFPYDGGLKDYYPMMNILYQTSIKICIIWDGLEDSPKKRAAIIKFYKTSMKFYLENRIIQQTINTIKQKYDESKNNIKSQYDKIKAELDEFKENIIQMYQELGKTPEEGRRASDVFTTQQLAQIELIGGYGKNNGVNKFGGAKTLESSEIFNDLSPFEIFINEKETEFRNYVNEVINDFFNIAGDIFTQLVIIISSAYIYRILLTRLNNLNNILSLSDDNYLNVETFTDEDVKEMFKNFDELINNDTIESLRSYMGVATEPKQVSEGTYSNYYDVDKIKEKVKKLAGDNTPVPSAPSSDTGMRQRIKKDGGYKKLTKRGKKKARKSRIKTKKESR